VSTTTDDVQAGQAVYSKSVLNMYDLYVHVLSNRFLWQCPSRYILNLYNSNVSANHLDVGVGTGYFLDLCRFPSDTPRLTLVDLNPECLRFTAKRISRYDPTLVHGNVLEPIDIQGAPFDSIALNYLLHCLPGTIQSKECVFHHLKKHLSSGGILFGATILGADVPRGRLAVAFMRSYNAKRIFCNLNDDLAGLRAGLRRAFSKVVIDLRGCVALFSASDA
jgi:ubiquinone/menaquinone biosynthesis C-methylase UbiE